VTTAGALNDDRLEETNWRGGRPGALPDPWRIEIKDLDKGDEENQE
jgi:hypothetical protein